MDVQLLENLGFWPITFLASFLIWVMFAALFVLWIVDGKFKKEQVFNALLATIIAWSISELIKTMFPTLRPFMVNNLPPRTLTVHLDPAFPSAHTAMAFGLASSIWHHHKKIGYAFILSAIFVGVGRVLGNVHFLSDILGGAFIGSAVGLGIQRLQLLNLKKTRGKKS